MTDADGAKVTAKKRRKSSNADENKVDKKRESEKPFTIVIDISPIFYLIQLYYLIYGKDIGNGEGGVLVTQ